jgi:hypothetical protein
MLEYNIDSRQSPPTSRVILIRVRCKASTVKDPLHSADPSPSVTGANTDGARTGGALTRSSRSRSSAGRSRGGFTTKIHLRCKAVVLPIGVELTERQAHDLKAYDY